MVEQAVTTFFTTLQQRVGEIVQLPSQIVPSDYDPNALALRVWVNESFFYDFVLFNTGQWAGCLGAVIDGGGDPLKRPAKLLGITAGDGAPVGVLAAACDRVLRSTWNDVWRATEIAKYLSLV